MRRLTRLRFGNFGCRTIENGWKTAALLPKETAMMHWTMARENGTGLELA